MTPPSEKNDGIANAFSLLYFHLLQSDMLCINLDTQLYTHRGSSKPPPILLDHESSGCFPKRIFLSSNHSTVLLLLVVSFYYSLLQVTTLSFARNFSLEPA